MKLTNSKPSKFGIREIVTSRARKVIRDYVSVLTSADFSVSSFPELIERIGRLGDDAIPALVEAAACGTSHGRVLGAYLIWEFSQRAPGRIPEESEAMCRDLLASALHTENRELRLFACVLLTQGTLPADVIPSLRELVHSPDQTESVVAACALSRADSETLAEVVRVLSGAIIYKDGVLAGIAGSALLKIGVDEELAGRKICEQLPRMKEDAQYGVLVAAKQLGTKAKIIFDVAGKLVNDPKTAPAVRQVAASVLRSISAGSKKGYPRMPFG